MAVFHIKIANLETLFVYVTKGVFALSLADFMLEFTLIREVSPINKFYAPIYNSIKNYINTEPLAFHMPGHKMGRLFPLKSEEILSIDLTEIPGLDNLHYPSGPIQEAQELAAQAFLSDKTYFLVNGSTCGIYSMIAAMCRPGDKLIVARDCHKSVIAGMVLAGVTPVYIKPVYNSHFGISTYLDPLIVEETVRNNPNAAGIMITRPNYYGICSDIDKIINVAHSYNMPVAVDEAHGAHLSFNDSLPKSSMQSGADICVQSAHKTLPALTQCSYLHIKGRRIDRDRLEYYTRIFQTTSPSYVFMASLDCARAMMQQQGKQLLDKLLKMLDTARVSLSDINGINVIQKTNIDNCLLDQTRLVINSKEAGISGYEMERLLRRNFNIQVEMSDYYNIVCIATIADMAADFESLVSAVRVCAGQVSNKPLPDIGFVSASIPVQSLELKEIPYCLGEYVDIENAVNRTCIDSLTPYPPGIPLICPGELINRDSLNIMLDIKRAGGIINGLTDDNKIRVVK